LWNRFCDYKNFIRYFFSWWNIPLNEDNKKRIWTRIQVIGGEIQSLLKPSPFHPKGRNAYAHIALCIKDKYGCSYRDIPDEQYEDLNLFLDYLKKNPN